MAIYKRISPHYTEFQIDFSTASIEDKISLFEDRIRGYIITPSRLLDRIYGDSILIVMLAAFSVLEVLEVFYTGKSSKGKSKKFFKDSFDRVFSVSKKYGDTPQIILLDDILEEIYYQIRVGLFHSGLPKSKILISPNLNGPFGVVFDNMKITRIDINPMIVLEELNFYISTYCTNLRNPESKELRDNFLSGWEALKKEG